MQTIAYLEQVLAWVGFLQQLGANARSYEVEDDVSYHDPVILTLTITGNVVDILRKVQDNGPKFNHIERFEGTPNELTLKIKLDKIKR